MDALRPAVAQIIGAARRNPTQVRGRGHWVALLLVALFACYGDAEGGPLQETTRQKASEPERAGQQPTDSGPKANELSDPAGPQPGSTPARSTTTAKPRLRVLRNVAFSTYVDPDKPDKRRPLRADIYLPAGDPEGSILLIHGGGWVTGSKLQMSAHGRRLANHGYLTMSIDYRLAPKHKFPAQIEDCWHALRWLVESGSELGVQRDKIAAVGYSAGGHLACLMGTTTPAEWGLDRELPTLKAVVAGGAPCNFEILPPDKTILADWLGGTRNEVPHLYRSASPLRAVTADDPPMFFFHGGDDQIVPSHISRQMAERLASVGVPVEYYLCEDKGHVSTFFDVEAGERTLDFLDRMLSTHHLPISQLPVTESTANH